jgi:hypothetical protein
MYSKDWEVRKICETSPLLKYSRVRELRMGRRDAEIMTIYINAQFAHGLFIWCIPNISKYWTSRQKKKIYDQFLLLIYFKNTVLSDLYKQKWQSAEDVLLYSNVLSEIWALAVFVLNVLLACIAELHWFIFIYVTPTVFQLSLLCSLLFLQSNRPFSNLIYIKIWRNFSLKKK